MAQFLAIAALILEHASSATFAVIAFALGIAALVDYVRRAIRIGKNRIEQDKVRSVGTRPDRDVASVLFWRARSAKVASDGASGAHGGDSVALLATAFGCAPVAKQSPPPPVAPPTIAEDGMHVEKVREELQLAPWDSAFSAVRGIGVATETVTARNLTDEPVTVRALPVLGDGAPPFALRNPPKLPAIVPPKGQLSVEVTFAPPRAPRWACTARCCGSRPDPRPRTVRALICRRWRRWAAPATTSRRWPRWSRRWATPSTCAARAPPAPALAADHPNR